MQDVNKRNGRDRGRVYRPLSVLSVQCFCKSKTAKALRLLLIQDIKGTLPGTQNNSLALSHN